MHLRYIGAIMPGWQSHATLAIRFVATPGHTVNTVNTGDAAHGSCDVSRPRNTCHVDISTQFVVYTAVQSSSAVQEMLAIKSNIAQSRVSEVSCRAPQLLTCRFVLLALRVYPPDRCLHLNTFQLILLYTV